MAVAGVVKPKRKVPWVESWARGQNGEESLSEK